MICHLVTTPYSSQIPLWCNRIIISLMSVLVTLFHTQHWYYQYKQKFAILCTHISMLVGAPGESVMSCPDGNTQWFWELSRQLTNHGIQEPAQSVVMIQRSPTIHSAILNSWCFTWQGFLWEYQYIFYEHRQASSRWRTWVAFHINTWRMKC